MMREITEEDMKTLKEIASKAGRKIILIDQEQLTPQKSKEIQDSIWRIVDPVGYRESVKKSKHSLLKVVGSDV